MGDNKAHLLKFIVARKKYGAPHHFWCAESENFPEMSCYLPCIDLYQPFDLSSVVRRHWQLLKGLDYIVHDVHAVHHDPSYGVEGEVGWVCG